MKYNFFSLYDDETLHYPYGTVPYLIFSKGLLFFTACLKSAVSDISLTELYHFLHLHRRRNLLCTEKWGAFIKVNVRGKKEQGGRELR